MSFENVHKQTFIIPLTMYVPVIPVKGPLLLSRTCPLVHPDGINKGKYVHYSVLYKKIENKLVYIVLVLSCTLE